MLQTEVAGFNQDGVDERAQVTNDENQVTISVRQHLSAPMKLDCVQELYITRISIYPRMDVMFAPYARLFCAFAGVCS